MNTSLVFKPLSPLQEEDEVECDLQSLAELLQSCGRCLSENELWAVCAESVKSLKFIEDKDLFRTLCLCPETLAFNKDGEICYIETESKDREFLPPEYNTSGPSFEGHLYSLAHCLLEATEYNLSAENQVEISNDLLGLITLMTLDDPSRRPSYEEILYTCLKHLAKESSSELICKNLWSKDVTIENNYQNRDCDRDVGIKINIKCPQDKVQQSDQDHSIAFTDTPELNVDIMNTKGVTDISQTAAAFDNLSQRAQEILKKIYSGTEILPDSNTVVSKSTKTKEHQTSIPENKEVLAFVKTIGHKASSSCSKNGVLLHDPWSSSDSQLASAVEGKRTMRSHSLDVLSTFDHRNSAFKKLTRQSSSSSVDEKEVDVQNSSVKQDIIEIHKDTKGIENPGNHAVNNTAKHFECARRSATLSVLPSAYSSKATHFTPIVISSDKGNIKQKSPVNSVKLKARIAMEAIKRGPQVPKKIPPPVTMLSDLEKDAVSVRENNSFDNKYSEDLNVKTDLVKPCETKQEILHFKSAVSNTCVENKTLLDFDNQENILEKERESRLKHEEMNSTDISSSKPVDDDKFYITATNINDFGTFCKESSNSKVNTLSSTERDNVTFVASLSVHEGVHSFIKESTSIQPAPFVVTTSSSDPAIPVVSLTSSTVPLNSSTQPTLPLSIVSSHQVSSLDRLSVTTQNSGKTVPQLANISGPIQLYQDPQTGLFHIIPVAIPVIGTTPLSQSFVKSESGNQSLSPNPTNYSFSQLSSFSQDKGISPTAMTAKETPTTFLAKTDLTEVNSSAFRPIKPQSKLPDNSQSVPSTITAEVAPHIPQKSVNTAKEYKKADKINPNKKEGNKKEYRRKYEKKRGVSSKLSHRQYNHGTDSESSESTYQDSSKLSHIRMPRYMKRTVRSNRVDVFHDSSEKTRSKSQSRLEGKERERSKSRDRAKSLDRKTHERLNGVATQLTSEPLHISNQDSRGRKRNTKRANVDPRSHVAFNLKDTFDDTKPLDSLNAAISPTSASSVSRDSGVHFRYSHSSGEDATGLIDNLLKDALVGNKVLRKVVKLIRIAFAFDGYLENGVEDLQMGEYIVSLAHLRWMTFASAITEKFCDLYWEDELLENLYEAVNGSLPEKSQRPLAMSPSRPRRKTDPIVLSPSNTPDNLDSDENTSIIDDLLPADNPGRNVSKDSKLLVRSNVIAHAKLFKEPGGKRKDKKPSETDDKKLERTKNVKDRKGINPKTLAEKLSKLENTKDGGVLKPLVAPRKKRNKLKSLNEENMQETIPEKSTDTPEQKSTKSNSLNSSQHLNTSMSSITSGSSHGSLSKSLNDPQYRSRSGSSVVSEKSVELHKISERIESNTGEQIVQTHRKPKMLAPSLPNPTTLARHSSGSSSSSGAATKHRLKSMMLNQKVSHAGSSLSLNSTSSGVTNSYQCVSKAQSVSSISSLSGSTEENVQHLLNSGVLYSGLAVDPVVEDYTNKLVVNCETQQGIETKIRVIDQELMMERKMRSKSQKFYQKMVEAQQLKAFPKLDPALNELLTSLSQNVPVLSQLTKKPGVDHKTMVTKVGKEIDEMTTKIDFLESAKRHLEMLYSEQWGLDHSLLYSFATSMGQEPMYLHHSKEECPLLTFHYMKSGCTLQAGEPLGLFSYLYARQSLLEGYIHHFFSTYHYYATTEELYKFIVDKFCAATSMSSAQAESRTKILCRTIDILQVWIENYYAADFRPNLQLVNKLSEFIREKIMPVDAQGECLLRLLEKRQEETEEDALLATLTKHRESGSHDRPKKRYSIREVLSVPTRVIRTEKMHGGITSCFSPSKKDLEESGKESIYIPAYPVDKGFSMADYTAQTLANQLTLIQQELFRKVHPVHYLNSRYHGIGVSMDSDISLASPALSRSDDRVEQDYPNLFINTLGDEGLVHILLEHAREVSHWVAAEVVTSSSQKYQIAIICKFITVARECYDMRNMATCVQIIDALDSLIVRQVPAWRSLPSKIGSSFEKLKAAKVVLKGDGETLTQGNSHYDKPTLPCSLFLLMHLQRTEIGGFTLANGMYKWTKMKSIAKLVDQIRVFQERAFTFDPDTELQELLRQRILQLNDHDIHSLAAQHSANFHQLAAERSSKRLKDAFKKVKTTLH